MINRFPLMAAAFVATAVAPALHAEEPKLLLTYGGHSSTILSVAFSPNGKLVASAARQPGALNWVIALWDAKTGKEVKVFKGTNFPIRSICFSPDGKEIASSGGFEAVARVYDIKTGKERLVMPYPKGGRIKFMRVAYLGIRKPGAD